MNRTASFTLVAILIASGLPLSAQTEVCVPQFLDGIAGGYTWRTMLTLQNREQTQSQVQLRFFGNNGSPLRQFSMTRSGKPGQPQQVVPNGQFSPEPIRARAAVGYCSGGEGALQPGSVLVRSQNRIQVHARLRLHNAIGEIVSESSVQPGVPFRNGWFFADRTAEAQYGLALVNPSDSRTTTCTAAIYADDGTDLLGSVAITIGPHAQTARYLLELFPGILTGDVGLIRISCSDPVCALVLHLRGLEFFQIPVVVEDPS